MFSFLVNDSRVSFGYVQEPLRQTNGSLGIIVENKIIF